MATILELVQRSELSKFDPQLSLDQQEFRVLYAADRLREWLTSKLPQLASNWDIETTPLEQFDAFMEVYASGETLNYQRAFHPIHHVGGGVWMLKTADLRIFGWFHAKDCFIGSVADTAQRIKEHRLYHGYAGEVVLYRKKLNLNEPKYIGGTDPNDVVSNFCFPEQT